KKSSHFLTGWCGYKDLDSALPFLPLNGRGGACEAAADRCWVRFRDTARGGEPAGTGAAGNRTGRRRDEVGIGQGGARRRQGERAADDRGSDPLLRNSRAVVQGRSARRRAAQSVSDDRPAERPRGQGR